MSQSNILELDRQGQVDAITYALNHVLKTLEVTGRAIFEAEKIIFIVTKSDGAPPQLLVEKYIKNFLVYLQIPVVRQAEIYAKDATSQSLQWFSQFSIESLDSTHADGRLPQNGADNIPFSYSVSHSEREAQTSSSVKLDSDGAISSDGNSGEENPSDSQMLDSGDFAPSSQDVQQRIQSAGLRGRAARSWQDAKKMYNKVPKTVFRLGAKGVGQYKRNHDWSHEKAPTHGEASPVRNGDWKASTVRGNNTPRSVEQQKIAKAKAAINFQAGTKVVARQAANAGKSAFGFELAFSGLNNFMAVQQGQKSVEDALVDTLKASATTAATTTVVTGGIVAISLVFPPAGTAFATAAPVLKIVGKVNCLKRVLGILSASDKVEGADQIQALMDSYGLDEKELMYRDLEMDDDLAKLKLEMGM